MLLFHFWVMDIVFFMFWMNLLFNRECWTEKKKERGIRKISLSLFLWFLYWLFLLGVESDDVLLCGRWSLFMTNDKLLFWTTLLTFLSSCFSDFIFIVHQESYCVIIISLNFSCYLLQRYYLLFVHYENYCTITIISITIIENVQFYCFCYLV